MKSVKKILAVLLATAALLSIGGCSKKQEESVQVEGSELILAAKEMYRNLSGGRLNIINEATGETERIFTFLYNKKGALDFSFEAVTQNGKYYEYYNGKALKVNYDTGEEKVFKWPSRAFKKYKKGDTKTHPNASTGIFFYEPELIKTDEDGIIVTALDTGEISYRYEYDIEKLGKYMQLETSEGKVVAYTTEYIFTPEGDFVSLAERSTLENGMVYAYLMTVTNRNEVTEIFDLEASPEKQEVSFSAPAQEKTPEQ